MTNLNEEQLEQVTGGTTKEQEQKAEVDNLILEFPFKINDREVNDYKGQELLFVYKRQTKYGYEYTWIIGNVIIGQDKSVGCSSDFVTTVHVTRSGSGNHIGQDIDLQMTLYDAYHK